MILIVHSMIGVNLDLITKILESCGRCGRGHRYTKEYRNNLDFYKLRGVDVNHNCLVNCPIVFDFILRNHEFHTKHLKDYYNLIVPCRADLIWDNLEEKDRLNYFCNRMRRLKEMALKPNSMTIPYELFGTPVGLKCIQNFIGSTKPLVYDWKEPEKEVSCKLTDRYNKDLETLSSFDSWYTKYLDFQ